MTIEKKAQLIDLKAVSAEGYFEGYASVFDVTDSYNDIVLPGAFKRTLKQKKKNLPKMLYQHQHDKVVGVYDDMYEDEKGLFVKGHLLMKTQLGAETYEQLKAGAIDSMSIGYVAREWEHDSKKNIRKLKDVDLWEVSLVTFPANDAALVTSIKSRPDNIRDFEQFLREAGYSRNEATTIAKKGFSALSGLSESADEELVLHLRKLTQSLIGA